jgi:hypothetical protein
VLVASALAPLRGGGARLAFVAVALATGLLPPGCSGEGGTSATTSTGPGGSTGSSGTESCSLDLLDGAPCFSTGLACEVCREGQASRFECGHAAQGALRWYEVVALEPQWLPATGDPCLPVGGRCGWSDGCNDIEMDCTDTGWLVQKGLDCIECSWAVCNSLNLATAHGTACGEECYPDVPLELPCSSSISTACGYVSATATCTPSGWDVQVDCPCATATDQASCALQPRCEWDGSTCVDT